MVISKKNPVQSSLNPCASRWSIGELRLPLLLLWKILSEKIIQDCFHLQIPEQPTFRKELTKSTWKESTGRVSKVPVLLLHSQNIHSLLTNRSPVWKMLLFWRFQSSSFDWVSGRVGFIPHSVRFPSEFLGWGPDFWKALVSEPVELWQLAHPTSPVCTWQQAFVRKHDDFYGRWEDKNVKIMSTLGSKRGKYRANTSLLLCSSTENVSSGAYLFLKRIFFVERPRFTNPIELHSFQRHWEAAHMVTAELDDQFTQKDLWVESGLMFVLQKSCSHV